MVSIERPKRNHNGNVYFRLFRTEKGLRNEILFEDALFDVLAQLH